MLLCNSLMHPCKALNRLRKDLLRLCNALNHLCNRLLHPCIVSNHLCNGLMHPCIVSNPLCNGLLHPCITSNHLCINSLHPCIPLNRPCNDSLQPCNALMSPLFLALNFVFLQYFRMWLVLLFNVRQLFFNYTYEYRLDLFLGRGGVKKLFSPVSEESAMNFIPVFWVINPESCNPSFRKIWGFR